MTLSDRLFTLAEALRPVALDAALEADELARATRDLEAHATDVAALREAHAQEFEAAQDAYKARADKMRLDHAEQLDTLRREIDEAS